MLHILNGESTAEILRLTAIEGEKFSFRDALICGPTPEGIERAEWLRLRAEHLSHTYLLPFADCHLRLVEQEQVLSSFANHDEVILWFEHDVFCQLNLLYLLDWFARANLGENRLSLINIGTFPGKKNFRGLGELKADELASLFPSREKLTSRELKLGAAAWQAYCSAEPTEIEAFLEKDTSLLPFLKTALQAHLRRFPSVQNGLNRLENSGLRLIHQGYHQFKDLFPSFSSTEAVYGLGDSQFWNILQPLVKVRNPLLAATGELDKVSLEEDALYSISFDLTDAGRDVLKGSANFVDLNGIDRWLGGVQLSSQGMLWCWDMQAERLTSFPLR